MKYIFSLLMMAVLGLPSMAQALLANDSVNLKPGYTDMVFYNLSTRQKYTANATDWHIAVTVQATQFPNNPLGGTTIRLNEANGVASYLVPTADAQQFNNTLDTTGYTNWQQLHDSDESLQEGALNSHRNKAQLFDFGWGVYSQQSHNVVGDSFYLIKLPNGAFRKMLVKDLVGDTLFTIIVTELNNSNPITVNINKRNYTNRFFVYVDLLTGTVMNKEPNRADWDLLFLKYTASDVVPGDFYTTTGVWSKPGVQVAEARGVDAGNYDLTGLTFVNKMNEIGWDWKAFNQQTFQFELEDSLAYYVQKNPTEIYKIVFTGFGGSASGVVLFNVDGNSVSSIREIPALQLQVYPNPVTDFIHVLAEKNLQNIELLTLTGQPIQRIESPEGKVSIPIAGLPKGIYLLKATAEDQSVAVRKVIVQ